MEALKHFRFRTFKWHCDVWFFPGHIESAWDEWGLGVQKGKKTIVKEQLQAALSESRTFGYRARGSFYRVAQFAVAAAAVLLFAPQEWRMWGWLIAALGILPLMVAVSRLRKKKWLNVQTKDGTVALALDISDWQPEEIEEFRAYFSTWMK